MPFKIIPNVLSSLSLLQDISVESFVTNLLITQVNVDFLFSESLYDFQGFSLYIPGLETHLL